MFSLLVLSFVFQAEVIALASDTPAVVTADVEKVIGTAMLDGKELKEGQKVSGGGTLITKKKSLLRLYVSQWNSSIVVGSDTEMKLDLAAQKAPDTKRYYLKEGICRWVSSMKSALMKESHVHTKSAAMGIRGTDFEIRASDATGETEIIVFDGQVLFQSNLEKSEVLLHKAQWGGVGGKFGPNVTKPVDLGPEDLAKAKARTEAAVSHRKNKGMPDRGSDY